MISSSILIRQTLKGTVVNPTMPLFLNTTIHLKNIIAALIKVQLYKKTFFNFCFPRATPAPLASTI